MKSKRSRVWVAFSPSTERKLTLRLPFVSGVMLHTSYHLVVHLFRSLTYMYQGTAPYDHHVKLRVSCSC
jgi:hypothetical protein